MAWKIPYSDIHFTDKDDTLTRFGSTVSLGKGSLHSQLTINSIETLITRQVFIKSGIYKGNRVAIKHLRCARVSLTRPLLLELKAMKELSCDHLVRLLGACFEGPINCLITEYCPRGSLQDVLENEKITLDDMFKYSLLHDIVKGLARLHSSEIKMHGNLKSTNCVVDSRFVLKVTDFGILSLRWCEEEVGASAEQHQHYRNRLWSAPEVLRKGFGLLSHDQMQRADIFSMGIIMNEIFCRQGTFPLKDDDCMLSPFDIVQRVKDGDSPLLRPYVSPGVDTGVATLMARCWNEDPAVRPSLAAVKTLVRNWNKDNESGNILDNLLNRMVLYSENLESLVTERTKDYLEEKKKCEEVLYQLLPQSVASQLIAGKPVIAKTYDSVTIYFSDIVGFTSLSAESSPMEIVNMLNSLYSLFDQTISEFDVYKVETIGDAYMVVSGLPVPNNNGHVREIAKMALKLLEAVKSFQIPHRPDKNLQLRIGIHSGPCVAGVVGVKMPRYCLFGDTVNTASRMESNGLPLKIHVSTSTYSLLNEHFPTFHLQLRGQVEMKGKGVVTTYWLLGYKDPGGNNHLLETNDPPLVTEEKVSASPHESLQRVISDTKSIASMNKIQSTNNTIIEEEYPKDSSNGVETMTRQNIDNEFYMNSDANATILNKSNHLSERVKHTDSTSRLRKTTSLCASSSSSNHTAHMPAQHSLSFPKPHHNCTQQDNLCEDPTNSKSPLSRLDSSSATPVSSSFELYESESPTNGPWRDLASPQSPLIKTTSCGQPIEQFKPPGMNRSSMKKITFITDTDSSTPLLVTSKINSIV